MVWTRAIDGVPMAGRPNAARQIRANLAAAGFAISESTIRPITRGLTLGRAVRALLYLLASLLRLRPLPLQCLLYRDPGEARRALSEVPAGCSLVYLDGVRCLQVLEALRRSRPDLAVVTDLDDLMSRRMALLLAHDHAPSTGYLKDQMPGLVERLLTWRVPRRLVLRYEAASLGRTERRFATLSDAVALISSEDTAVLRGQIAGCDVRAMAFAVADRADRPEPANPPFRFIFVGSDSLRQNQLTIDALLDLWRREALETPLAIFGQQQRSYDLPAQVTMAGYVESLDEIHDGHSILLTPSYVAGGVKTKVLEAFAWSTPVIGNAVTFESIATGADYPLQFGSESAMLPLLRDPAAYRAQFAMAVRIGKATIRRDHDPVQVRQAWCDLIETAIERHAAKAQPTDRTGRSQQHPGQFPIQTEQSLQRKT
ncbi:MAG: glycosyltransferase [Novosphingobium sp.]